MGDEYNSVLSTLLQPTKSAALADTDISAKAKYRPDISARPSTYNNLTLA